MEWINIDGTIDGFCERIVVLTSLSLSFVCLPVCPSLSLTLNLSISLVSSFSLILTTSMSLALECCCCWCWLAGCEMELHVINCY